MEFDLEQELIKRNISVREIMEDYSNGQMFSTICRKHKLTPDQLRFILRYNENEEINNKRNSIICNPEEQKKRFKEIISVVEGKTEQDRDYRKRREELIYSNNKTRDINDIIEKYRSGMSLEKIMTMYRLTEEQLNKFISENVTQTIKNQRQENREKFAAYGNMKITAQRKNNNKVLTKKEARDNVQKAINLVEGNDELSL